MANISYSDLFPLPLTPFERYMVYDNRAAYPMAFPWQLDFSGKVDRLALEAAIEEARTRHPLLCANVKHVRRLGLCFVDAGRQKPAFDWNARGVPLEHPGSEAIDLAREVGVRVWVRETEDGITLTIQFHHACCDGLGAIRFLEDLFLSYAARTKGDGPLPAFRELDWELLRRRGQFQVEYPEPVSLPRVVWSTICEAAKWIIRRPTPLAAPTDSEETAHHGVNNKNAGRNREYPNIVAHRFDEEQSRSLRKAASQAEASVNDLLLRDMFLTMKQWNDQYGSGRQGRWMAINMPQSLRKAGGDHAMPAANIMSYTFITRRTTELADPQALLDGVHQETKAIAAWSLGLYFIAGLGTVQKVPGLYQWLVAGNRCFATTILSNLGNFNRHLARNVPCDGGHTVLGDLRLEGFRVVPPIRPKTLVSLAVFTYANCLNIDICCDPRHFSPSDSQQFLTRYVRQIEQTMRPIA